LIQLIDARTRENYQDSQWGGKNLASQKEDLDTWKTSIVNLDLFIGGGKSWRKQRKGK